eukprot:scaffold3714_cov104-Phaeocystis_antarctica.AAC.2
MVGGGKTPPFAALLGPDWIRARDGQPSYSVEGCSHKRPRSSAPDPDAQRAREHRGLDKQLPARSEAGHR